jgi:hypothetical protein
MNTCKRVLAGLLFLLGTAGLLLSVAGGVGVWLVKEPVTASATEVFGRVDSALDLADQSLAHVKSSLARAADRLDKVKEQQRERDQPNLMGRILAQKVQRTIAPQLANAHEKLHTVAEAAVVVNTVLEDVGSFPFLSVAGLDLGDLTVLNGSLSQVEASAWELSRLLGEPGPASDAAGPELSRIERALKTMRGMIAGFEPKLTQVRERTEQLKSQTLYWITPAAILASIVCFWIALSQVSLLAHAWSWWRSAGRSKLRPS